jgi:hypothetical protein
MPPPCRAILFCEPFTCLFGVFSCLVGYPNALCSPASSVFAGPFLAFSSEAGPAVRFVFFLFFPQPEADYFPSATPAAGARHRHQAAGARHQAAGARHQAAGARYQAAGTHHQAAGPVVKQLRPVIKQLEPVIKQLEFLPGAMAGVPHPAASHSGAHHLAVFLLLASFFRVSIGLLGRIYT